MSESKMVPSPSKEAMEYVNEKIEELKKFVYRCIHCRACRFSYSGEPDRIGYGEPGEYSGMVYGCVAGMMNEWEPFWASGKNWITRAILEGKLEISDALVDFLFACPTCGNCQVQCDNRIPTVDLIEHLRAYVLHRGITPRPRHIYFWRSTMENNNPYGEKHEERTAWIEDPELRKKVVDREGVKMAYYVGCTASYRQKHIANGTAKLLDMLGEEYAIYTDEWCCGSPSFRTGNFDVGWRVMKHNIELFQKQGIETIFFSCAGCFRTWYVDYPKHAPKFNLDVSGFKFIHAVEYFYNKLKSGELRFKDGVRIEKKVCWHDPCHTGRHIVIFERERRGYDQLSFEPFDFVEWKEQWFNMPREILKSIPGIEFVEMYRIKDNSMCCGCGGGLKSGYPDMALEVAYQRLKEAEAAGAEWVVTSCPFCWRNLYDAQVAYKTKVEVRDLTELLLPIIEVAK